MRCADGLMITCNPKCINKRNKIFRLVIVSDETEYLKNHRYWDIIFRNQPNN